MGLEEPVLCSGCDKVMNLQETWGCRRCRGKLFCVPCHRKHQQEHQNDEVRAYRKNALAN